jgi:hypothetical protein
VSGGNADVAIVYGTGAGVSALDVVQAGNVQSSLQSFIGGTSGGTSTSTSGETVSLDTSADRIWLNTSLNAVRSTLTKSDLPTVLQDSTFDGDETATLTSTIKLVAGAAAGGENSGKVIFAKQPKSSNDPVVAVSLGTSATSNPLYNASVTFSKAINFTDSESEGEELTLFGQDFTVASATSGTALVLLKQAERADLTSDSPSTTLTIGSDTYVVELVSASDTSATIKVTNSAGVSASKEVDEAASKRINGVDVAVITADETNLKLSASVVVGSEKITLTEGATVTAGESDDPIDGTFAYLVGSTEATTEIAVVNFRADSSTDAIAPGESYVDPVFGSFKVDFAGLSSPLDDANREMISVQNSGDDTMTLSFTDQDGNSGTFDFAHNATYGSSQAHTAAVQQQNNWRLSDDSNFSISVHEGANLSEDEYIVLGNEDYGHILRVIDIYNDTSATFGNDRVKLQDTLSGTTYDTVFTSSGSGTLTIDGKQYTVTFPQTDGTFVRIKYPTSDTTAAGNVFYPTIETQKGALVQLYEPLNVTLSQYQFNGTVGGEDSGSSRNHTFYFPDGDGYTTLDLGYLVGNATFSIWRVGSTNVGFASNEHYAYANYTTVTVGAVRYNISGINVTGNAVANRTFITLIDPEGNNNIDQPAVVVYEGKDENSEYHAVVVDLETAPAGSGDSGVGVNDVLFSSDYYHAAATMQTNSDLTQDIDWWGTLVTTDATESDQKTVDVSYPSAQVYSQIFVGASGSVVSSGGSGGSAGALGDVLVRDSEIGSVGSKNLIVVGGSCINSVAASLVGGALCGSSWTSSTGAGSGQFVIQSFARSGKVALLVAGYDAADTVNAATYLRTQTVDTAIGKKYIGTSSTSATLQVA